MKLRKLVCTAVALAATSVVFAGNTSELKQLIDACFMFTEAIDAQTLPAEELASLNTAKALKAGLLKYEAAVTGGNLTGTDEEIHTLLTETIPATLNKIKTSSDDVAEELTEEIEELSQAVLKNQKDLAPEQIEAHSSSAFMLLFAYAYVDLEGNISVKVSRILQEELMLMMQSLFEETQEAQ